MKYRRFGKLDWEVSALGFGAMRLPLLNHDPANIDEAQATQMLRYAIDHGVNYVDTAYLYHGGNSERVIGRALRDGYRDKVKLATKMPCWFIKEPEDFDRYLHEQLERLQTDHVEFYLLHGLIKKQWVRMYEMGVLEWSERAIADGRIGHLGFSFHDSYPVFQEIVDAYEHWTFCQIQYNYMNEDVQAGTQGLEYAAAKGLAVVIMEPLLGGDLADPPEAIQSIWDQAPRECNPADMALQWLWNKPEISVVLSGMSTMDQVRRNIASANRSGVATLSQADLDLIARVRNKYQEFSPIPCTRCGYCMPCPNGVDIPRNFEIYNGGVMYNKISTSKHVYNTFVPRAERASACIACRECEEKCPQRIEISRWMLRIQEELRQDPAA